MSQCKCGAVKSVHEGRCYRCRHPYGRIVTNTDTDRINFLRDGGYCIEQNKQDKLWYITLSDTEPVIVDGETWRGCVDRAMKIQNQ